MRCNRCSILWMAIAFLTQQAFSQATAPAPPKPQPQMVTLPNLQLNEPPANTGTGTGVLSVLTVQLDTLRQVLAMAMSEEEVKKLVDYEDRKFGKDDRAKLSHRRDVVVTLMARLKENCK